MPVRLLIADDHEIVRVGVRTLLKEKHKWETCGYAENGREAIAKVWELSPDVVILDLSMPVMNGFEALQKYGGSHHQSKLSFILFTMSQRPLARSAQMLSSQNPRPRRN